MTELGDLLTKERDVSESLRGQLRAAQQQYASDAADWATERARLLTELAGERSGREADNAAHRQRYEVNQQEYSTCLLSWLHVVDCELETSVSTTAITRILYVCVCMCVCMCVCACACVHVLVCMYV